MQLKDKELDKEVAKISPQINLCYFEAHNERATDIYEPITIKFLIGNLGGVTSSTVFKNKTGDETLGDCVAKQFLKMKFKVERGHVNIRYLYTLNYNPKYK